MAVHSFTLPFVIGGLFCLPGAWVVYQFVPETVNVEEQKQRVHSASEN